ncbi:hypothetical protein KAU40_01135 [Candidatus Parcubacteria bacterium]|nr:hypothetical protein [Candidatus Parcubacteria bacterium]
MYKLLNCLEFLKSEIEKNMERLKKTPGRWEKQQIKNVIQWEFERAISLVKFAEKHGRKIDKESLDWFFGERKERPDIQKLKRYWTEEERMEKEAKNGLRGKINLLLWRAKTKNRLFEIVTR